MPLSHVINAAAAPIVLITADAFLLSAIIAKYTAIAGQMRALTAEWREDGTNDARRANVREQLRLFSRRIAAMWAASLTLCLGVLLFLTTVVCAVFESRAAWVALLGAVALLVGIICLAAAVLLELVEIRLARLTMAGELADVFVENETTPL